MRAALLCLTLLSLTGCSTQSPTAVTPVHPTPPPVVIPPSPHPSVSSISPTSATAGGGDVTVTISGSHFIADGFRHTSLVIWFGTDGQDGGLAAKLMSSTEMTATIRSELLAKAGTAQIDVFNGDVM